MRAGLAEKNPSTNHEDSAEDSRQSGNAVSKSSAALTQNGKERQQLGLAMDAVAPRLRAV
jgi:hypothetical protein